MKSFGVIFLFLLTVTDGFCQDKSSALIHNVSVDEFKAAIDSLEDEVVIDLRTPDELRKGKIPGALVIDFFGPDFEPALEKLNRNKVYLLYCASGGRSGETAGLMADMGFKKRIYNLEDGFGAWVKRKLPVEK